MRAPGMTLHKVPLTKAQLSKTTKLSPFSSQGNTDKNKFIEWGFTDAEGNFTISIDNRGSIKRFTDRFMTGLHIDDKPILLFIRDKLGCGMVSTDIIWC